MDNGKLNSLVVLYQQTKSDETFTQIYEMVAKATWNNLESVAKSIRADVPDLIEIYEDVLMRCIDRYNGDSDFINFYRYSLTRTRTDLYRKKKRQHEMELSECELEGNTDDEETDVFEYLINGNNTEDVTAATVMTKKEADQRQLIDLLLSGVDSTTTAIVKTFLAHPKPTPTAIGKHLGLHHSVVIRKLTRLATKYDAKKFGDYRDFLVAHEFVC